MERPARRRRRVPQGRLLRQHGRAGRDHVAPRALRRARGRHDWTFMSDVCKHCAHAGCLDACPTGALIRTEFDTVVLQPDVCNGCGYCIPACPFGVIDRDHDDGRAAKCTLCYDRLEDGLEPACAKACPTDSIQFGAYEDLVEVAERRVADAARARRRGRLPVRRSDQAGGLGRVLPAHRSRPSATACPRTPSRRSRRTSCPRRSPRSAPGCWRRRAWRRRSCGRGDERRARHDAGDRHRRATPAFGARDRRAGRRCTATTGATRAGRTSTATTRTTRAPSAPGRGATLPAARRGRAGDDEGAGVDVGDAAVLLVRRDRVRLGVRGAGLRPRGRPPLARGSPGSSRSARSRRRPPLLIMDLGPPGALPATCCGSSRRARRCRWARGR